MSDLLNAASLVMIPSGYSEDKVYSAVPTDGSGDLSFTRASNGTRVNSAGLVEVCPWNLVTYSEDFTNGVWTKTDVSITANSATAPNGTTTADLFTTNNASGSAYRAYATATTTGQFIKTISVYFKYTNYQYAFIVGDNYSAAGQYAIFDLINGTNTFTSSGYTATITSVGNGWFYCTFSGAMNTDVYTQFGLAPFNNTYAGFSIANGKTLLVWGAQLNIGSTAKPYFPTTDRLNVPRLTYQNGGGGCPSLLLEKQSTNMFAYSEQFDQSSWTKQNSSVTANATTSPDGTQNADKFIASNANVFHAMYGFGGTLTGSYTMSVYAKKSEYDFLVLHDQFSSTFNAVFNLNTGAVVSGSGASIENIGNGWYRCIVTFNGGGNSVITSLSPSPTSSAGTNYLGDGTSGVYIWGAQLEASSYATSLIPTTSASATRVADACSKTSATSLIGQTEGVLFTDFVCNGFQDFGTPFCINDGSTANSIWLTTFGNGTLRAEVFGSGSVQASISMSGAVVGQRYKMAFAYKANDFVLYINGTQIGTDTSGSIPTNLNRVDYDYAIASSFALSLLQINQSALFKTRLTNAELASLTTL